MFVGPQIRRIITDQQFDDLLIGRELNSWLAFKLIVGNFLGNHKSPDYEDIVRNCIDAYKTGLQHVPEDTSP